MVMNGVLVCLIPEWHWSTVGVAGRPLFGVRGGFLVSWLPPCWGRRELEGDVVFHSWLSVSAEGEEHGRPH